VESYVTILPIPHHPSKNSIPNNRSEEFPLISVPYLIFFPKQREGELSLLLITYWKVLLDLGQKYTFIISGWMEGE
jgi:hypothetical protein